ncbi:MAG: EAL domain-containing protein [Cyanobacteria bacterium SBC]|nr:EAL domain-containing protein [Cyanobacteria bacterium SBC]
MSKTQHRFRNRSLLAKFLRFCCHRIGRWAFAIEQPQTDRNKNESIDLYALFDALPIEIATLDAKGCVDFKNRAWRSKTGGATWLDTICPDDRSRVLQEVNAAAALFHPVTVEYCSQYPDRGRGWTRETRIPLSGIGDVKFVSIRLDRSDVRQMEQRVREREIQLDTFVNGISEGILVVDRSGCVQFANPAAAKLFDRSVSALVGHELGVPIADNLSTEVEMLATNGRLNISQMKAISIQWNDRPAYAILLRDITDCRSAEAARQQSQHLLEQIADLAPNFIRILDLETQQIIYANRQAKHFFGIDDNESTGEWRFTPMGIEFQEYLHPDDIPTLQSLYERIETAEDGEILENEFRLKNQPDRYRWRWWHSWEIVLTRTIEGQPKQILGTAIDITERKQMEEQLRQNNAQLRAIFSAVPDLFFRVDSTGQIIDYQAGCCTQFFVPPEQFLNQSFDKIFPTEIAQQFDRAIQKVLATQQLVTLEYTLPIQSGLQHYEGRLMPISQDQAIAIVRNITDRKQVEEQLRYDALHDALTGLPNRTLFVDRLDQAIRHAKRRTNYLFAVLFIDLDRFKIVNESVGHIAGDRLLVEVARRLENCLRTSDTVARLGGDEFSILLDDLDSPEEATRVARRIQKTLLPPFEFDGHEMFTTVSIGIALSSTGYRQSVEVLRDADIAMYRAKERGKARYEVFDRAMHERAMARLGLETELWHAVDRLNGTTLSRFVSIERQQAVSIVASPSSRILKTSEFRVHYQPIVCLQTGHLVGFEALIRWQHPRRGMISPVEFIPVAEETGAIVPLGEWILEEACQQLCLWRKQFPLSPLLHVSVNLSGKQLEEPEFLERVDRVLARTQLPGACLKLEITESILMEDREAILAVLKQLRTRGVELSIDDFGTGYSCLSYLQRFPINTLKVDRSFVSPLDRTNENLGIVQAILNLAIQLGMSTVAEGIETKRQFDRLKFLGCRFGQGYFFARPLDADTATKAIEAWNDKEKRQWGDEAVGRWGEVENTDNPL